MKKSLNSSILAATSLTALTVQHQTEASTVVFTNDQLASLGTENQLEGSNVGVLDFSKMTPETAVKLQGVSLDLSKFDKARNIILSWFASKLSITLPENFGIPQNDIYSRLTIVNAGVTPTTDADLKLDLSNLLNIHGKVTLDSTAVAIKELKSGSAAAKIARNPETINLSVSEKIEAIDTFGGAIADDTKTSITVIPTARLSEQNKVPYAGLPTAVIGANPSKLDISEYSVAGKNVSLSGLTNLESLTVGAQDTIGTLTVTGNKEVTTNAASIQKAEVTSETPVQSVLDALATVATSVAVQNSTAFKGQYKGLTNLDFSTIDFGSVDATASRIKEIITDSAVAPLATIQTMKIQNAVLDAVMVKLNITNLSSFAALKKLELVSAAGAYQTTALTASDLPTSIEEFYSSSLVVRKGTLSADLEFDKKFAAVTLDLSGLDVSSHTITIGSSFTASSVTNLKLNPSLLAIAATKNLISAGSNKTVTVLGAEISGQLTTANLQNVGTIDLRAVTGASVFSAPLDIDGNNSNLSKLYLPSAFTVATNILSGVDNGEVTVYLSGAYSNAQTMDASYDKTILNFSAVTGTGRFRVPSGVRGLILSDFVKGINVGSAAIVNEFNLSGLTAVRQIVDLPTTATMLKLNNSAASSASELNLTGLTHLTTLQLGGSRISKLSLPATAALTDGGEDEHLDLSNVKDLAELNGLNALLALGSITTVSFPNNPASTLHINLVATIPGLQFNNLDKIPELTLDSDYFPGEGMWPSVKNKAVSADWVEFFNYIMGLVLQGGINSPSMFDLSGQSIANQTQADALVAALGELSSLNKSVIQKIVIRIDSAATGAINLSALTTTDFTHNSLKIIIDQSTGSTATVTVPTAWNAKTATYISLDQVDKTNAISWTKYLGYHFASTDNKGEGATSLDLSAVSLTAGQWSALMTSLNGFATPAAIETISLKLIAADTYSTAPAFTTATLSAVTSIIVDITGVKNSGSQVVITGLPNASSSLQVEQRVTDASSVDRTVASSWKGYIEHLLSTISGSNYTLDLTATDVQIQTAAQLTALNSALEELSSANKAKIKNINLKLATGNRGTHFRIETDLMDFDNLTSFTVDATGALNGSTQSSVVFDCDNGPLDMGTYSIFVTNIADVIKEEDVSWYYYFLYRLSTDGIGISNLDLSSISFASQSELTAFLTSLNAQSADDKATVQSIKVKLASNYSDNTVDLSAGTVSGLSHGSFAVEVDRNGANSTAPVSFVFGSAITSSNTTIKDTAFTGLGSFDGTNPHHWLGYARTLLSAVASGTTTLDLSVHNALEINSAKLAKFIIGMNALPAVDKAKIATLKIKLTSGNFGTSTADLSGLSGFTALTSLVVERNGARSSSTLYDPAVSITGLGTTTVNDSELRTVSATAETNKWLGYLRFILNGMSGTTNTLDVSAFALNSANAATALSNALEALPASEKDKIQSLKISASAAITLGTGVSGLTNLTKVIVDQTAAPAETILLADDLADATAKKFYVTSASTAQTNNAWAKYIDYAMSSVANGGLNQTTFDLTGLTLSNTQVGQFLTALDASAGVADVTAISLKLATAFGANTLTLPSAAAFTSLVGADAFKIYRNAAANSGTLVSIDQSAWSDSVVQIIDPTATTVADQTSDQDWLKYLSYVTSQSIFDATSGFGAQSGILDLTSIELTTSGEAVALITALELLDSSLKAKLNTINIKLATGDFGAGDLVLSGTLSNAAGFTNLSKFTVDATGTETNASGTQKVVDFSGLTVDGSKDMWVSSLASVDYTSANAADSWLGYINYLLRDGNASLDTSAINSGNGLTVAEAGYLFDALETLSASGTNKARLTYVNVKLANAGGAATLTIDQDLSNLNGLTSIIVDVTGAMHSGAQVAVDFDSGTFHANTVTKKAIVSSISSVDKDNTASWTCYFNTAAMTSIDVSSITLTNAEATAFLAALGTGVTAKADITSLTMKLDPTFGAGTLSLNGTGLTGLQGADRVSIQRNGAVDTGSPVLVSLSNGLTNTHVRIVDATAGSVADATSAQDWLKYLTGILSDAATGHVLDLRSLNISASDRISAFNAALNALDGNLKDKVAELWLTVTAAGELGTSVSGLTNLTKVIVDQTAAPTASITIAADSGATGELADAAIQKFYVTSASTAQTNNEWAKYIDYAMSSVANGGLNQTAFDLTGLTLTNTQVGQFFAGFTTSQANAVTAITLKLATAAGSDILTLASPNNFTSLTGADAFKIYRNAAANSGTLVSIGYNGWSDSVVQIIDPTATTVTDTADAQQWLGYLTGVLNDAASGVTLDLSSFAIDDAEAVTAFNVAVANLDSALANKVAILKLAVTHADNITLGAGSAGFSSLTRMEFTKPSTHTVTFADTLSVGRTYLTNLTSVKMDTPTDWSRYLNYMLSTTAGGQSATSLNLNSRIFAGQTELDAFFTGLNALSSKNELITLRLKLDGTTNTLEIGGSSTAASSLNANLRVIVDPNGATGTSEAGSAANTVQAANLIVLSATPAFSKEYIAYVAEPGGFDGTVGLTGLDLEDDTFISELNALSDDIKTSIKTINLKLKSGNFGSAALTLGALTGFTGLTINIDRNEARADATTYGALVTVTNNTSQTVNLTDAEFHNMGSFENESSAHWVGYLTHELNSAASSYTLDLTVNSALVLDSANSVTALNEALTALSSDKKAKVAMLKVKSSVGGALGSSVTGFSALTKIAIDYTAASVAAMTRAAGFGPDTPTLYHYISDARIVPADATDWTRFFNYQLNAAVDGGLESTDIALNQHLSTADLTGSLPFNTGLNAAAQKALLQNLTLNLASNVTGDISLGASGLSVLNSVTINTNGSDARITPQDDFFTKTAFSSVLNVNSAVPGSWRAYLKGQSSITAIDIREIELANQAQLNAFLNALNAASARGTVETIKIKLASSYTGTASFATINPSGLTALVDDGVEIHRNGSTATAVAGGSIASEKIKIVDLTADSLTDRSSAGAWRSYLTALIADSGFGGEIDLSTDSDIYLRTNAHVTAFMSGLQNLSPTNKLLVTSLTLELAPGAAWTNIANLGQGLTGFDNLLSFTVDATGALTSAGGNPQVTVGFHGDLTNAPQNIQAKAIVSSLSSVDKDSTASWTYFFSSAAMTSVDVSAITLTSDEATAFLAALGTGDTAKAAITSLTMKLDPTFGAASLAFDANNDFTTLSTIAVHRNGAVDTGIPVSIAFTNTTAAVSVVDPTITDTDSVLKTNASSWLAYLTDALSGAVTELDLTDDNLVLSTAPQATALDAALDALDSTLKAKVETLKIKAAANVTIGATLTSAAGFTALTAIELDKPAARAITVSTIDGTTKLQIATLDKVTKSSATEWEYYLNYVTRAGAAAFDISSVTLAEAELTALDNALNTFSNTSGNGDLLYNIHIKVSGAASATTVHLTADLDAQTFINTADKFIVDVSDFIHAGSQAVVDHTGGDTPKDTVLRNSNAAKLNRNSAPSWGMYLNSLYPNGIPNSATLNLTGSSNTYLRNQADVNALMTAIQARPDKPSIGILNVRLAPGNVDSDITFGTGVTFINPTINITATGATNNGKLITTADIFYAGSFDSTGKTVTQEFATTVVNKAVQGDWTKYLTYVLSSTAEGGLGRSIFVSEALTATPQLTALMNALNGLSSDLKNAIHRIHIDVSHANFNGGLALGTGVSGLSNLLEVTYIRASAQANATAEVVGSGDFENKIQRLRTAWNSDSLASAATVEEYLRYVLMDTAMGGAEQTTVDLTSQTLDNTRDGYLYTAIPNLSSDLLSRITELRLNFNTNGGVGNYSAITLPALTTVKYFQTGSANFVAPSSTQSVTTTRFRALPTDVTNQTNQTQWAEYINYVRTAVNEGGLGLTTLDVSSVPLTSLQINKFLQALDNPSNSGITGLTVKLDPTFGAATLDLSPYGNFTGFTNNSVIIQRNGAVYDSGQGEEPVSIIYYTDTNISFTDETVKIIDPDMFHTAGKDNTRQQWLEYLTYTINDVGFNGLLTIAPANPDEFDDQAQIYLLFDAMEALDSSLKTEITKIIIDISSIAGGKVYLMRTGDVALTGFDNLTKVIYKRAGIDTNIGTIITSLKAALDADGTLDAIPTWVFADETARDAAIDYATDEYTGNSVRSAILQGDAETLKSELITLLANGITFPATDVYDTDVDAAEAAVSVTVDGDVKNTLATALTPFRSTGKISAIGTALTSALTNGSTTGLGTLPWLKSAWAGYADHDAVMTAVLADGDVTTAIGTNGQSIANIKTAVSAKLNSMLISYGTLAGGSAAGTLGRIIYDMDLTSLTNWNDGTTVQKRDDFRLALENAIRTLLETNWVWFTSGTIADAINTAFPSEEGFFPVLSTSGNWNATTIKQELFDRLKGVDDSGVAGFSTIVSGLTAAINDAFTAANATLTTNTAAWVRPTAGIESDLKASIKTALEAFPWYTGDSDAQSTAAVAAGDVANQNAATIISNIKTWLTENVGRPTATSIFSTSVNTVVDALDLEVASTVVTTEFTDVVDPLSRYRVAPTDVSNPEDPAQWTEYLLYKLSPFAEGGLNETTIDVIAAPFNNDRSTHFMGGLSGLPDNLRTRVTSIKLAVNDAPFSSVNGGNKSYNDNLKIIMDITDRPSTVCDLINALKEDNSTPLDSNEVVEPRITSLAAVNRSNADSWGYYLNYLKATNGNIESIDLATRDLYLTNQVTTQANVDAFFTALQAHADKATVKDIFINVQGLVGGINVVMGSTTTSLTALTSVVIRSDGTTTFGFAGNVGGSDLVVINSATNQAGGGSDTLGASGTVAQWKGYLAYLLEDAAHGGGGVGAGCYAGSPITVNLTASDLLIVTNTVLDDLETAIAELPARLKARISAILIKTFDDSTDLSQGNTFGDGFNDSIADFSALQAVVIDASNTTTPGNKPAFPVAGAFFSATTIAKIVY